MVINRKKLTTVLVMTSILVLVTFACNFISGGISRAASTETTVPPTETSAPPQNLLSPNSAPMSSGLILKSATDTQRDITSYQLAYLEDLADGFLPANQNEIDMYFAENHNFTVHVNSSKQPLVWTTGWCAQGKDILSQNLSKVGFEMSVDGQPVDLNQVYKTENFASFHTAGDFCVLYRLVVSGWPSGTTILTSKTILNEPVDNGTKEYQGGAFTRTYEVINLAETNQAPGRTISGGLILGSKAETQTALDEKAKTLKGASEGQPFTYNGTTRYDLTIKNPDLHLLWFQGWCTTTESILTQNLKHLKLELRVNDQLIDLNTALASFYTDSSGLHCVSYSIVMYNWPASTTVVESKLIFEELINDGLDDYPAGVLTKVYVVNGPQ
jgi:hypothetical protein